jgi:hypothetical protein
MFPWFNLLTAQGIVDYMSQSSSSYDWNRRAANVRYANLGRFPKHWYTHVVNVGLPAQVAKGWIDARASR